MRLLRKSWFGWRQFSHQMPELQAPRWVKPSGYDTGIVIYNPSIKKNVPLILKNDKIATWYMCGPTVYDSSHIGHACSYVRFDIIRRILTDFFNINVVSIMGITDIDDKIIMRSQGSSKFSDWNELATFYTKEFYEQMKLLNVQPPYSYEKVSDYIPQIITFIQNILEKNFAYIGRDGSVYFDRLNYRKFTRFGRYEPHEPHKIKKSTCDFALWKAAKPYEPSWESPWGPGRPGWHIECSTIGSFTLGSNIDIHSGGMDLIFPHHENEDVQSCCYHDTEQWVNYWIHSGLLQVKDIKMSKSLQNSITITELLEKYTANQFRMMCLLSNYLADIEFTEEVMNRSVAVLRKFDFFQSDCQNYMTGKLPAKNIDENLIYSTLIEVKQNIQKALVDNFSTSIVISELENLVAITTKMFEVSQPSEHSVIRNGHCIAVVSTYISKILSTLGILNSTEFKTQDNKFNEVIDTFVNFRAIVRNNALNANEKNTELLTACDHTRKKLGVYGIQIKDYKDKSTWALTEQ